MIASVVSCTKYKLWHLSKQYHILIVVIRYLHTPLGLESNIPLVPVWTPFQSSVWPCNWDVMYPQRPCASAIKRKLWTQARSISSELRVPGQGLSITFLPHKWAAQYTYPWLSTYQTLLLSCPNTEQRVLITPRNHCYLKWQICSTSYGRNIHS